jgi:hypothetical protein
MARAVRADNVTHAAQILIDAGTHQAHPIPAEDPRTGEERHEPRADSGPIRDWCESKDRTRTELGKRDSEPVPPLENHVQTHANKQPPSGRWRRGIRSSSSTPARA